METACISIPSPAPDPEELAIREARIRQLKSNRTPSRGVNNRIPDGLFNDIDPRTLLQKEKPVHRKIVALAQNGLNCKEIADMVNMAPGYVSNILRQPWARERIVSEIKKNVRDELHEAVEAMALPALERIQELAIGAKSETVRAAQNQYLVDRFLGRPAQPISQETANLGSLTDKELERIASGGVPGPAGGADPSPTEEGSTEPGNLG